MRYTYSAGEFVGTGCYLSFPAGDQVAVGKARRFLPGEPGIRYFRVPWPVVVILAPVVSFLFVVFLPLAGIAMTLYVVAEAAIKGVATLLRRRQNVIHLPDRMARMAPRELPPEAPVATPDDAMAHEALPLDELRARREGGLG